MGFSHEAIASRSGIMPPQELKDIMARCGMQQADVATAVGSSRSSVCCWLKGRRVLSGVKAAMLRLMDEANTSKYLEEIQSSVE